MVHAFWTSALHLCDGSASPSGRFAFQYPFEPLGMWWFRSVLQLVCRTFTPSPCDVYSEDSRKVIFANMGLHTISERTNGHNRILLNRRWWYSNSVRLTEVTFAHGVSYHQGSNLFIALLRHSKRMLTNHFPEGQQEHSNGAQDFITWNNFSSTVRSQLWPHLLQRSCGTEDKLQDSLNGKYVHREASAPVQQFLKHITYKICSFSKDHK